MSAEVVGRDYRHIAFAIVVRTFIPTTELWTPSASHNRHRARQPRSRATPAAVPRSAPLGRGALCSAYLLGCREGVALRERTRQRVIYARSEVRLIRELAAMGKFGAKAPGHCT